MNSVNQSPDPDKLLVEEIHAFVDDELALEDRQRVRRAIKQSPELAQMVCDIDQVQDWVRAAYEDLPAAPTRARRRAFVPFLSNAVAASALLTVGALAGWFVAQEFSTQKAAASGGALAMVQPENLPPPAAGVPAARHEKVLLRLGSDSPQKFHETLEIAEHMLKTSAKEPGFQLEVLANADGLNFLRSDTSPYAKRIEALIAKYPNVHFLVCGTSLVAMKRQGEKPDLLPNVHVTPSAVERVVERLRQGWQYYAI